MSKLKLSALLIGAALFLGFGTSSLSAQMKCGAGKCGSSMQAPKACNTKACKDSKSCNKKGCECGENCKCGDNCKCGENKASNKCGSAKCGSSKKATAKCGAAKCGSN